MPETNTSVAMSFACPNYSGALYTKSNIETPFLNAIGAPLYTKSVEFVTSQDYALEDPSQPAISEADSVKGVYPDIRTARSQPVRHLNKPLCLTV